MLAAIGNYFVVLSAKLALVVAFAFGFAACATKEQPQLVSSGTERESSLPWNKQEKWENQGQLGGMAERFNTR